MTTLTTSSRPPRALRRCVAAAAILLLTGGAFALGRWTGAVPAPSPACPEAFATEAPAPPARWADAPATAAAPPPAALPPAAPAPPRPAGARHSARPPVAPAPVSTVVMARAADEVKATLERLRADVVSRCREARADPGRVKLTYNLAFDAAGRELARAVHQEHGAAAEAFGSCLKNVPGPRLSISPPGATVAVTVALHYP